MDKSLSVSPSENRERAFYVWYACGGNDTATVRELKKEGFSVTRQTISDWKQKYCWAERAAAIDTKKTQAADAALTFEESLLEDLKAQKQRYDDYFDALAAGKVDNQAMYVYSQLTKQILDLTGKLKPKQRKERKGLTAESAADIKEQILGIKR